MEYLAMRARVRAERSVPKQLQNRCFAPYDAVKDQKIRSRLLQIALITQFLDRCFANYFRAAVLPLAKEHVDKLLDDSRKTIAKMQNKQGDPESADIGDLGRFCEQSACAKWHDSWDPNFTTTQRRDHEVLHYLQDALEIPYWEFMADIFLVCNVNSSTLIGEVVLRVLYSAKLDLLDGRRRLRDELALLQGDDAEDIIRITDGIDARITVLESIWDNASSNPDGTHQWLVSLLERPLLSPSVTPEKSSISLQDGKTSRQKTYMSSQETATLMALILVFIVAAIIPGYKAFAISMQENAVGSIHDADFWSLIQSSIMAVMGNIIMVVPLLKKSWLSPTYGLMWAFFALGLVFAVISVVLYPLLNPGWSSMVAFFGSIASVASVLIATQATAREGSNGEVKLKPD
ncbi:hypothetical protein yc1106_06214 [Curvularia clavata]|uniref:Uncharacterized protein n=1 Tax=Curvularia clavata TaxID=95742 RepID=A0A9Q9DUF7_CURCL|nr:hypothetical protein yc1106_06214 [Curvularia clavata]